MAILKPSFGRRRSVTPLDSIRPNVLARRFEPSFGRKYRIGEFPLKLGRDDRLHFTQMQSTYPFRFLPIEICTFGQTMVENQKAVTGSGFKGLTKNARPNDGLKAAKRWLKSQVSWLPHKKAALGTGEQAPLALFVPREKRAQKRRKNK